MTSFSSVQYTSSGTPRVFPQVKKQVHLGKDARSSDVLHFVCFWEETWNCMHFLVILSRFYVYRNTYFISRDSKMSTFEVFLFCVWCLDNWSRILSGKPFNRFSMARLKTFYSRDPRFISLIDSPWFVKFSKMGNFYFRESWFRFTFQFLSDQNPPPLKVFVYGKGVHNSSKFANIFFFNFHLYF